MNVIHAYLESMFSAYPQTPRLAEAKTELLGMMEDAYSNLIADGKSENEAVGAVIRDFGNIEEVAPVLGITSEIAPESASSASASPESAPQLPAVTLDEAKAFADARQRVRFRVSTAIMLFVLSPAVLIALPGAANSGLLPITETAAVFTGILVLLALAASGVLLLISASRETAPHSHIAEHRFTPNPVVTRWADSLAEQHEHQRIRALQIAIALWILAPIPLIAFALFLNGSSDGDMWTLIGVVLVLVIVATGLRILLPQTWAYSVAKDLGGGSQASLAEGERSIVSVIASFYWPLLTAIFLGWSFIGNAWGISWIVWPVGGVLFGAIAAGVGAIESYRKAR